MSTVAGERPDSVTTTAAHSEKLSPLIKLAFGAGDLGPAIVSGINGFFLNAFLFDAAGLRLSHYPGTTQSDPCRTSAA